MQLCEACGTEIVDPRDGVCPSCGFMLPLLTTPTRTQPDDPAAREGDPAGQDAPSIPSPLHGAGPDAAPGQPEPEATPTAEVDVAEAVVAPEPVAAESVAPEPAEPDAAEPDQAEAGPVESDQVGPGHDQTPPVGTPAVGGEVAASELPSSIVGGAAIAAAIPQARWHPDSLPQPGRARPSRRRWFVLGGVALAVIAAVVVIVLIVTAAIPQRVEGLALLRDLPSKPIVGAWELEHPLADEVPNGAELYVNGYTAGPSTAVMVWSTDRPLDATKVDSAEGETMISLVNTMNGHTLWERRVTELSEEFDRFDAPVVVSPPDAAAVVVSQGDLMVSVSRRDGRVVSTSSAHSSVEGIGFPDFAAPAAFVPGLEGDLLISSTRDGVGTVGRYRSTDLADPIWEVSGGAGERATTAGDKLFYADAVYSLEDGSAIDWQGDLAWYYQQLGRDLVAIDYSGNDTTIRGVDARTGEERWKATSALPVVLDASGLLVVADQSGDNVRRLDPRNGDVEWRSGLTSTWDGAYTVGDTIMLADGSGGYTGISAQDGAVRYEEGDADGSLVGFSDQTLVLTLDGRLVGIDATSGERSWSVPSVGEPYGFTAWGGSVLAVASVLPAGASDPAVVSVSPASDD